MSRRVVGAVRRNVRGGVVPVTPGAQSPWKANWLTDGGDPQRTSWQRNETILSPSTRQGHEAAVEAAARQRAAADAQPVSAAHRQRRADRRRDRARSPSSPAISDNIYGIDVEKGTQIWKRQFDSTFEEPPAAAARSAVPGRPDSDAVIAPTETPGKYTVYAISWDGRLRQLDVATGEELAPPAPFLPPNGKPYALNLHNNVIYTTRRRDAAAIPNQFYGYDLATKKVGSLDPGSGGLWPRLGPSIGKDGTVYAGSGDGDYCPEQQIYGQAIIGVKQNPTTKALELKDWYAPSNADWLRKRDLDMNVTGPVFDYKGKEYMVQSSKECRIWLLDTSALGGEDHRTPVYRTPLVCNEEVHFAAAGIWGALTTWEDADGTRWVLHAVLGPEALEVHGADRARPGRPRRDRRIQDGRQAGKPQLVPAWLSRDMDAGRTRGDRQRRRLRVRQRRGHDAVDG